VCGSRSSSGDEMIPKRIEGASHYFGAPKGWSTDDPVCAHLAVRVSGVAGHKVYESAWEPTPRELDLILKGGTIVLRVLGMQSPVMLYVEAPPALVDQE
jgi:hypothetical protein